MKYSYYIAENSSIIFEYENDEMMDGYPVLIFKQKNLYPTESFIRIQKWLLENHPECLL